MSAVCWRWQTPAKSGHKSDPPNSSHKSDNVCRSCVRCLLGVIMATKRETQKRPTNHRDIQYPPTHQTADARATHTHTLVVWSVGGYWMLPYAHPDFQWGLFRPLLDSPLHPQILTQIFISNGGYSVPFLIPRCTPRSLRKS